MLSPWTVVALAIVLSGAVVVGGWLLRLPGEISKARSWAVKGPPCPALTQSAFNARAIKPSVEFEFDGASFARAFGHVYCDDVHDDGGRGLGSHQVCQFTGPALLRVTTAKGAFYFFPSTGRATVTVSHGIATCVRGGWFKGGAGEW